MKELLDTQALLSMTLFPETLPKKTREILDKTESFYLSMVSLWEIVIKTSIGKLELPVEFSDFQSRVLTSGKIEVLPIREAHLNTLSKLPWHHRDPFDRLLIAQAKSEALPVWTSDKIFRKYGLKIRWK